MIAAQAVERSRPRLPALYFCTSKASKLSTSQAVIAAEAVERGRVAPDYQQRRAVLV